MRCALVFDYNVELFGAQRGKATDMLMPNRFSTVDEYGLTVMCGIRVNGKAIYFIAVAQILFNHNVIYKHLFGKFKDIFIAAFIELVKEETTPFEVRVDALKR